MTGGRSVGERVQDAKAEVDGIRREPRRASPANSRNSTEAVFNGGSSDGETRAGKDGDASVDLVLRKGRQRQHSELEGRSAERQGR